MTLAGYAIDGVSVSPRNIERPSPGADMTSRAGPSLHHVNPPTMAPHGTKIQAASPTTGLALSVFYRFRLAMIDSNSTVHCPFLQHVCAADCWAATPEVVSPPWRDKKPERSCLVIGIPSSAQDHQRHSSGQTLQIEMTFRVKGLEGIPLPNEQDEKFRVYNGKRLDLIACVINKNIGSELDGPDFADGPPSEQTWRPQPRPSGSALCSRSERQPQCG
ncbi:hypothetical protein RRG08_041877 [Elysia crispata]|uniref:Uncharacterized protein n=1 Tax=Elysia crispata TaxID=231223 RepID=A0AAE0Y0G4_9GAST|nr:hypothetical protein RRG08_041877 [Elysia crispata]